MGDCSICLEPLLEGGALWLGCGHQLHASCLLPSVADEPLVSWRCPCCRAAIDPGAVRPAAELPADGRGREFFLPQPDVEAGTCSPRPGAALMLKSGKSGGSGSSSGGPLVGVGSFVKAAAQALANQEAATAAGAGGKAAGGAPPNCGLARSSSWALRAAERVLPEGASWAAATALASLRLRQLLNPKASPSLCVAAAVWANALALTLVGCALGAVLLRCFMTQGVRLLCRVNRWTAALLQLSSSCDSAFTGVPAWMVALVCAASLCLVCELERGRPHGGGRLWPLLLRLEAHAPRLLLRLYCAAFILAANMLLLAYLFNLGAILGAWLSLTTDPLGSEPAWSHDPVRP